MLIALKISQEPLNPSWFSHLCKKLCLHELLAHLSQLLWLCRFDRELLFPLPAQEGRAHILDIHTRAWADPPSAALRQELAAKTVGFCGADLKVCSPDDVLSFAGALHRDGCYHW